MIVLWTRPTVTQTNMIIVSLVVCLVKKEKKTKTNFYVYISKDMMMWIKRKKIIYTVLFFNRSTWLFMLNALFYLRKNE